ncbi:protein broad-minded [Octopus sinensis]|uniref:Protein broad-minded n=1 Tax=Octopus sinensis TaxID=2607531 RepID=A0A7E6ETL8_9MOLL|nr:protein broad-minded [Octopus sinensis]XP_036358102.1 protein broad-minded [Octopus sinensis]
MAAPAADDRTEFSTMEEKLDSSGELVKRIKQLFICLEPYIHDARSLQQVEETLRHLEEYNDNFHRLGFVKQLRRQVESILGPLIDEEIDKHSSEISLNSTTKEEGLTLVERITDTIINSKLHKEFHSKLKVSFLKALDILQKNFDSEFGVNKSKNTECIEPYSTQEDISDEEGSCATSFNQSSLMFVCHEKLLSLTNNLVKTKSLACRREAMRALKQVSMAADIIGSDHWSLIRQHLFDVLCETDEQLSALSLKFISHAFNNMNPHTKEIYNLLVESLIFQILSHEDHPSISLQNGLNVMAPEMVKIFKMFRLMHKFQLEVPKYWMRYSEKFLTEVLESSLKLICCSKTSNASSQTSLEALHLFALFDYKATWFSKWMHGVCSRAPLLKLLETYQYLVENSVRYVLNFIETKQNQKTLTQCHRHTFLSDSSRSLYYSSDQLQYAVMVHSMSVLGCLLLFKAGRQLFPVHMLDMLISVNVTQLLLFMCNFIVTPIFPSDISHCELVDPAQLATNIFRNLASKEDACAACLCKNAVTERLISPISQWLIYYKANNQPQDINEVTVVQTANILCEMTLTSCGRKHLLYGEDQDLTIKSRTAVAHQLAQFTEICLMNSGNEKFNWPSQKTVAETLYVCRLLYNTCEGLHILQNYQLHNCIKYAWIEASLEAENSKTPIPEEDDKEKDTLKSNSKSCWQLVLEDSLLSFANTARGVALITKVEVIDKCVANMNERFQKQLQVSKFERFGYGTMVSKLAAAAPGITALNNTGFIKNLLEDTWTTLECGTSDIPPTTPKQWSTDVIDRTSHKKLRNLISLLFCTVPTFELLAGEKLPKKDQYDFREIPTTIAELIDRIVLIDSSAKIHSLFNYDESHIFGLRFLSDLIYSLDICLLLQAQYQFQELLLKAQEQHTSHNSSTIIIDMISLERNYILVQSYLVGGPTERQLPPRTLQQDSDNVYSYPLFSKYPVPDVYTLPITKSTQLKDDPDLLKLLPCQDGPPSMEWLTEMQEVFCNILSAKPQHTQQTVNQQLLERTILVLLESTTTEVSQTISDFCPNLSPQQLHGIKLAIRYGESLGLLSEDVDNAGNLEWLLNQVSALLQAKQQLHCKLKCLQSNFKVFDWFVASIYLVFQGNKEQALKLLTNISRLTISKFLWPVYSLMVVEPIASEISVLYSTTAHYVDFLLQIELPLVAAAFTMSGFSSIQVCQQWLQQCFWNYLDWSDIVHYICTCCVLGADYQIYLCIAILHYLQTEILSRAQQQTLLIFLKEEPIRGFHICHYLNFMKKLEVTYRDLLLSEMCVERTNSKKNDIK